MKLVAVAMLALTGIMLSAADRPPVAGRNGGVSAGHPLTTAAAFEILTKGGNAFDAGVAALLVGGVVEQDLYSLGGEALVLVYPQSEGKVTSIVGQGWAPKGATIDWYTTARQDAGRRGSRSCGDSRCAARRAHGPRKLGNDDRSSRCRRVRSNTRAKVSRCVRAPRTPIKGNLEFFKSWPDNQRYWLKPDGSMHQPGATIKLPTLARTLTRMVEAERAAQESRPRRRHRRRARPVLQRRYRRRDGRVPQAAPAPFELIDFAEFFARIEDPAVTNYRGYQVYKHSFGSQGPVLLQALEILETVRPEGHEAQQRRLHSHGHRSAEARLRRPRHLLRAIPRS